MLSRKSLAWAAVICLSLGLTGIKQAGADELDDQLAAAQEQANQIAAARAELESNLAGTTEKLQAAVLELNAIEARLPVAEVELARSQAATQAAVAESENLAAQLTKAQEEYQAVTTQLGENQINQKATRQQIAARVRNTAKGQSISTLGIVSGAQNPIEFKDNLAVATTLNRTQARQLAQLQDAETAGLAAQAQLTKVTELITGLKVKADAALITAQESQQQSAARRDEIADLRARQSKAKADIEAQRDIELLEIENAKADQLAIAELIKSLAATQQERARRIEIERRREAKERAALTGEILEFDVLLPQGPPATTFLHWPTTEPVITSTYGERQHPTLGISRLHAGTDFRAFCGTPIYAAQSGIVVSSSWFGTAGNMVVIDHGDDGTGNYLMSRYLHLSKLSVSADQWVSQGQLIGYSGATGGISTGCHLHFETYVNGQVADPMTLLS